MIRSAHDAYELQLESAISAARSVRDAIRGERARFLDTYGRESELLVVADLESSSELKSALLAMLQYRLQQTTKAGAA